MNYEQTQAAWARLLNAYIETGGKILETLRIAKVTPYLGRRLINEGDSKMGLPPVVTQVKAIQQRAVQKTTDEASERMSTLLQRVKSLRIVNGNAAGRIREVEPIGEKHSDGTFTVRPKEASRVLKNMREVEAFSSELLGIAVPTNAVQVNVQTNVEVETNVKQSSAMEEIQAFAKECGGRIYDLLGTSEAETFSNMLTSKVNVEPGNGVPVRVKRKRRKFG